VSGDFRATARSDFAAFSGAGGARASAHRQQPGNGRHAACNDKTG